MTQTQTTPSDEDSFLKFQNDINALTKVYLMASDSQELGVMTGAAMNIVLNAAMALKGNPDAPPGAPEMMMADIRKMVDYIESELSVPPENVH